MKRRFSAGDRVRVADDFFWAKGAIGTVSAPPDAVTAISGPWEEGLTRREVSALGTNTVYWVWFDEPQHDAERPISRRSNLGECPYVAVSKTKLMTQYLISFTPPSVDRSYAPAAANRSPPATSTTARATEKRFRSLLAAR